MVPHEQVLSAPDGHRIAVHIWRRETRPLGTLHWLHGMAEHGGRYARLAEAVNELGWHLVTHDHRGHGTSVAHESDRGHFADQHGWEKAVEDVATVREYIEQQMPGEHHVLGGHSMGSFLALDAAERAGEHYKGLVLCGSDWHTPFFYRLMRLPMLLELKRQGPRGSSGLIRKLTFDAWNKRIPGATTDYDWLSSVPEEVAAYINDPHCGHDCSTRLWVDLVDALRRIHSESALASLPKDLPILVIAGGRDPMSHNGRGSKALARALRHAGADVDETVFPQGRHEILNDRCAPQAQMRITEFLQRVSAPEA